MKWYKALRQEEFIRVCGNRLHMLEAPSYKWRPITEIDIIDNWRYLTRRISALEFILLTGRKP